MQKCCNLFVGPEFLDRLGTLRKTGIPHCVDLFPGTFNRSIPVFAWQEFAAKEQSASV
jgi:hypothetical protein